MNLKHDDLQKDPPGGNHFTLGCEMDIGKSHPKNWTHRVKTSAFWYSQICFMLYLWTLSKHHRNLWLDKWSPKHFLPSDTHVWSFREDFGCWTACILEKASPNPVCQQDFDWRNVNGMNYVPWRPWRWNDVGHCAEIWCIMVSWGPRNDL